MLAQAPGPPGHECLAGRAWLAPGAVFRKPGIHGL